MVNLIHELRMCTNAIHFFRMMCHKTRDAQYMEVGQPTSHPYPLYMGTGSVLLSLNMSATRHLAYFDGTIYSA